MVRKYHTLADCAWLVLHVFCLFCAIIELVLCQCSFPKFIRTDDERWITEYGEMQDMFEITETEMRGRHCWFESCVSFQAECIDVVRHKTRYALKYFDDNSQNKYLCIEFIWRGDPIIQIRKSYIADKFTDGLCHNSGMLLYHRPFVKKDKIHRQRITCPLSGGFNIAVYDHKSDQLCPKEIVPSRMEIECELGEGISFHFRSDSCSNWNYKLGARQKAYCVAHWDENEHTFLALRSGTTDTLWCLRYNRYVEVKDLYLFVDFICDPEHTITSTEMYLHIYLERYSVSSNCADEFDGCAQFPQFCMTDIKQNCPKSCGKCAENKLCVFPEYLRSSWMHVIAQQNIPVYVNISHYTLDFEGKKFECLEEFTGAYKGSRMLLQSFDNGCFPRYLCLQTEKKFPSVLTYRLGTGVTWPLNSRFKKEDVCNENQFLISVPDEHMYREIDKPPELLINAQRTHTINCKIPTEFENKVVLSENRRCHFCMIHRARLAPDIFIMLPDDCESSVQYIEYQCLARFTLQHNTEGIVTRTNRMGFKREWFCWLFTSNGRVVITDPTNCNNLTASLLATHVFKNIMYSFNVTKQSAFRCQGIDSLPYFQTTKSTTTSTSMGLVKTEEVNIAPGTDRPNPASSVYGEYKNKSAQFKTLFSENILYLTFLLCIYVFI